MNSRGTSMIYNSRACTGNGLVGGFCSIRFHSGQQCHSARVPAAISR